MTWFTSMWTMPAHGTSLHSSMLPRAAAASLSRPAEVLRILPPRETENEPSGVYRSA